MNRGNLHAPSTLAIWAAMLSVYIVWGSTYLAIRFSIQSIPPFLMAGIRFLIAGGILFAWRRLRGDPLPSFRQLRSSAVVGLFLLLGGNGAVVWAEQRVVSGVAALLVGSSPLWMVLVEGLLHRGRPQAARPGWISTAGILLGFAGIAVLVSPGEWSGMHGQIDLVGAGMLTLAAFLWAAGSVYSRNADLPSSPLMGTALEMLCGGAALTVLGTLTGEWSHFHPETFTLNSLLGFGYLVIFGSLVGYSAYTWLLRVAPIRLVSTYAYVNPIVAIFIGNLLAAEPLTLRVLVAALVIVGAVALITFTHARSGRGPEVETPAPAVSTGDD